MVMALEAAHGRTEESLPDRVDHIVEVQLTGLRFQNHGRIPWSDAKERACNQKLRVFFVLGLFFPELITGNLFDDELVVRFVVVKRARYIVAVSPHVGAFVIVGQSGCIGIACNVQPMLGGTFSVMGTFK